MRFAVLLLLLFVSACQGLENLGSIFSETPEGLYHTVQKGQTLYSIAKAYGKNPEYLARLNGVRDPKKLQVGRRLWIPGARRVLKIPDFDESKPVQARKPESGRKEKPGAVKERKKKSPEAARPKRSFFIWPLKGILTSGFGRRNGRNHEGIDIYAKKGTPIVSAARGKVVFSGWGPTGYGRMIIIKHDNILSTLYAHNTKNLVKEGDLVVQGQRIALVGSTGRSTGPHLHFEVRENTRPRNPIKYLPEKK